MTSLEMLYQFQKLLVVSDPTMFDENRLETFEIYFFLNLAQKKVFKDRYFPSGNIKENLIIITNNNDELKNLFVTTEINNSVGNLLLDPNMPITYTFDYSSLNYAHYIRSDSVITRETVFPLINERVPNNLITYLEVSRYVTNSLHTPIIRKPALLIENENTMRLFVDKYTTEVDKVLLTYLRYPNDIDDNNNCELSEKLHYDIVMLAVDLFRSNKYLLLSNRNVEDNKNNNKKS